MATRSSLSRRDKAIARSLGIPIADYRRQLKAQEADRDTERARAAEFGLSVDDYRAQLAAQGDDRDAERARAKELGIGVKEYRKQLAKQAAAADDADAPTIRTVADAVEWIADGVGFRVVGVEGNPAVMTPGLYAAIYTCANVTDAQYEEMAVAMLALVDDAEIGHALRGRLVRYTATYAGSGPASARHFSLGASGDFAFATDSAAEALAALAERYKRQHLAQLVIYIGRPRSLSATRASR